MNNLTNVSDLLSLSPLLTQNTIKLAKGVKSDIVQAYTKSIKGTADLLAAKSKHLSLLQKSKN